MKKKAPMILNQILLKVAQYMLNQGTVPPMRAKVMMVLIPQMHNQPPPLFVQDLKG